MRSLPLYETLPPAVVETTPGQDLDPGCARCELHARAKTVCLGADGEPGGLLVVGESPGRNDDAVGRPFLGEAGGAVRKLVKRYWRGGPVVLDNAIRCAPGKTELKPKHAEACRPFLAGTLREARPTRVVTLGGWAAFSVLGRSTGPFTTRRGYSFLTAAGHIVPVFSVFSPHTGRGNRFVAKWFEQDMEWALTATPARPPWDADVHVIETVEDAERAVAALRRAAWSTFDVESAGLMFSPSFRLLSVSFCAAGERDAWCWGEEALRNPAVAAPMLAYLEDPGVTKGGTNVKFDMLAAFCHTRGTMPRGVKIDVRLWRKLLEPEADARLERMAELVGMGGMKEENEEHLDAGMAAVSKVLSYEKRAAKYAEALAAGVRTKAGKPPAAPKPLEGPQTLRELGIDAALERVVRDPEYDKKSWAYALVPKDVLYRYNARDTVATTALVEHLEPELRAVPELARVWDTIVQEASSAVARVESWGVASNRDAILAFDAYLEVRETELLGKLNGYVPQGFNWSSPDQVAELLFHKLGMPVVKMTKSGEGESTDKDVLEVLRPKHPVIGHLIDFRSVEKLRGTYAKGLLPHVRPDGRIHPTLLLDGARCMPAGELVLTSRGYLPIEDVKAGDKVLTHEGRARAVLEAVENPPSAIYQTRLASGHGLRTNGAHQFWTTRGWVRADELRLGDEVFTHGAPEEWRPLEGWPYQVSSWGRVRSNRYGVLAQFKKYTGTRSEHLKVTISRNDSAWKKRGPDRKDFAVHRLVALAFDLPRGEADTEVRHLNGIAWDNRPENLAWGTSKDNRDDARAHGTMLGQGGRYKLEAWEVELIRSLPREASKQARGPFTDAAIASRVGVTREAIRDIRLGKRRQDLRLPEDVERKVVYTTSRVVELVAEAPEPTFGVLVEEDHSHVTAGIVTHNTGRWSCQHPNLQNQPRPNKDRPEPKMVRDNFVASPGCVLIEFDYSQIEIRVAAMLSQDPVMMELLASGEDFHLRTAQMISKIAWGITPDKVNDDHRSQTKTVNFGILYGKTATTLAREWGVPTAVAQSVMDAIFGRFKKLADWMAARRNEARKTGESWTWWDGERARRRPLYRIADPDDYIRSTAENGAVNTPVQGTANEFCVASLVKAVDWIESDAVPAKLVLAVHDSMLFDVQKDAVEEVLHMVPRIMLSHNSNGVGLKVDAKMGPAWGSLVKAEKAARAA